MTLLAKSTPPLSLIEHLSDVRQDASLLLTPARVQAFARVGVGAARAEELLLSAAWLHDWGKATHEWQEAIHTSQKRLPQHSLTGFFACLWATDNANSVKNAPEDVLAMALAVLAHHGQLSDASFKADNFAREQISIPWDVWDELLVDVPLRGQPQPGPANKPLPAERACEKVGHAHARLGQLDNSSRFRGLYCLLLTLLVQADHAASGGHAPDTRSVTPPHQPGPLTTFQTETQASAPEVLCAVAGCGSGKTLAALLRAAQFARSCHVDRIVLCLPTRFTGNSLLRDMTNPDKYAYANKQVGLVHSEAVQVLKGRGDRDEDDFPGPENMTETNLIAEKSVRYEMPVTVSTVDHLLMSLYHGYKFADRAFGNLLSSLVVFDEVHAYDAVTLNAIREGLQVLQHYGVPTLFMSATLPSSRRRFFGLSDAQTVMETDNPYHPFQMEPLTGPLTKGKGVSVEASPEARQCLQDAQNLKLVVYVNQVERAKALARAAREVLPDTNVYCYHSELAPRDRQALEEVVIRAFQQDAPVVLIATQAAELSLDISAERMITELAPADTLVQRAGRLHRRGRTPHRSSECQCPLCQSTRQQGEFAYHLLVAPLDLTPNDSGDCPAALPYKDVDILQHTWDAAPWNEVFTFERGLEWCETVLTTAPDVVSPGLWAASLHDSAFGRKPQENFAGEANPDGISIRDIDDDVVLVLPETYAGETFVTLTDLAQFQVPVRRRKFYSKDIDRGLIEERTRQFKIGSKRQQKIIDYPIKIIKRNLKYDAYGGGFDFRVGDIPLAGKSDDEQFI